MCSSQLSCFSQGFGWTALKVLYMHIRAEKRTLTQGNEMQVYCRPRSKLWASKARRLNSLQFGARAITGRACPCCEIVTEICWGSIRVVSETLESGSRWGNYLGSGKEPPQRTAGNGSQSTLREAKGTVSRSGLHDTLSTICHTWGIWRVLPQQEGTISQVRSCVTQAYTRFPVTL